VRDCSHNFENLAVFIFVIVRREFEYGLAFNALI
jgi:hypothetical protein